MALLAVALLLPWSLQAAIDPAEIAAARENRPPRKVLLGTVVSGYAIFNRPLAEKLAKMDEWVDAMGAEAAKTHPGRGLDLAVLPEYLLTRVGKTAPEQAVTLAEVLPRIAECAKAHGSYLVAAMVLREPGPPVRYSNAAALVDRTGTLVGIYRKVHPVAPQNSELLEGGLTPGHEFPVFDCDFGRVGIQICFDLLYPDGWQALARQGAEIVALPTASPETVRPSMYALQHSYYIVNASPRDHAAVYNPLGMREAEATQEGAVMVDQIDLSYAVLHWDEKLEEGAALAKRFGEKVGYHYYRAQDTGIFWSNDPGTPIGRMIAAIGLHDLPSELQRLARVQDQARGGAVSEP